MKKRLVQGLVALAVTSSLFVTQVSATPQDEADKHKQNAENLQNNVDELNEQKKQAQAEANSVNQELVSLLVDYSALEKDLEAQKTKISDAQTQLDAAEEKEKKQYEDMKLRIKYMYEEGDSAFIETIVSSKDFSDLINKAEYVSKVHKYDRTKLDEYVETKQKVADAKVEYESQQAEMEELKTEMQSQKANLESTLTQMRSEISNFDDQLASAKKEAAAELKAAEEAQQEADEMAAAAEAEQKAQEAAAQASSNESQQSQVADTGTSSNSNKNSTSNKTESNNSSSDKNNSNASSTGNKNDQESSDKEEEKEEPSAPVGDASRGQAIASKACEYIGNKYVYGGTSLTNGIDCSGFVQAIHRIYGISTPRSSGAQRSGGVAVKYSDMLPGDVICYSGHVAIYIGNNKIVHASNSAPYPVGGIKISSPPNYRTVLAVRRYW